MKPPIYEFYIFSQGNTSSPETALVQYGVLGIFCLILVVVARSFIKREQDRADRLEAEVIRLNTVIQEKTIPALLSATEAIKSSQMLLQSVQLEREVAAAVASRKSKEE